MDRKFTSRRRKNNDENSSFLVDLCCFVHGQWTSARSSLSKGAPVNGSPDKDFEFSRSHWSTANDNIGWKLRRRNSTQL